MLNEERTLQHSTFSIQHSSGPSMLLNYEDLSPVKKSVEIEIPADLISNEAKRVTSEFTRHAKLPGFRPGLLAASPVRSRFAKETEAALIARPRSRSIRHAIADKGVEPVGDPQLQHSDSY